MLCEAARGPVWWTSPGVGKLRPLEAAATKFSADVAVRPWVQFDAVVPWRYPSLVLLMQFVPQCEEGGVGFDAAVERVWA